MLLIAIIATTASCKKDSTEPKMQLATGTYDQKIYKAERCAAVNRKGFGMNIVHDSTTCDTMYLRTDGIYTDPFAWDLLLYNQFTYYKNTLGDWSSMGNPTIFMYTDTIDAENSVKGFKIGEGIGFFDSFTADDITQTMLNSLKADPLFDKEVARDAETGYLLRDTLWVLYDQLVIGNHFMAAHETALSQRINNGEQEEDIQAVYLIRTRNGYYAKFMVYQFRGDGVDSKRTLLKWQVLDY